MSLERRPAGRKEVLLLVLLVLLSGCGTAPAGDEAAPARTMSTRPACAMPDCTPLPPRSPALAPTAPPPTQTPLPPAARLEQFEQVWQAVADHYLYPDFHGLDWQAVHDEFEPRIAATSDEEEFYQLLRDMVGRLDDEHSRYLSPAEVHDEEALARGSGDYSGIGILGDRRDGWSLVEYVFPGSPADEAGLKRGDRILAVEGQPVATTTVFYGPEGTTLKLTVRSPDAQARDILVRRRPIAGKIAPSAHRLSHDPQLAYLVIPSLWANDMHQQVELQLREQIAQGPLDGLVLDLRANGGGWRNVLEGLLSQFVTGEVGNFYNQRRSTPLIARHGTLYARLKQVPLVVLIDGRTESYAEVLAGVLQAEGRARIVGVPSPGNTETLYAHGFADGSRLWLAQEAFRLANGVDLEGRGITPDSTIAVEWADYREQDDPQLAEAIRLLR